MAGSNLAKTVHDPSSASETVQLPLLKGQVGTQAIIRQPSFDLAPKFK
jgi:hypothetical protein